MYCTEKNIQILIALLKAHNIKKIIASPGTTNMSFVGSMQNDPWFEMYSAVDERGAAYMACGMAAESGEPVVLSCTGATASRNYYPGLTEAFYRKLPVLAVTSHQGLDRIGQLISQNIDRRVVANDIARYSIELPVVKDQRDGDYVVREANKAILELSRNGGGPVHINMLTTYSTDFVVKELPDVRVMHRYYTWDKLPEIPAGPVAVFVGSHVKFTDQQTEALDAFCATYDAIAICDHTSGYYGKYRIQPAISLQQQEYSRIRIPEFVIHIGEVSAAEYAWSLPAKEIWRVSEDGEVRDGYKKLTNVFQMSEEAFFMHYAKKGADKHSMVDAYKKEINELYNHLPELPFSNIWSVSQLSKRLPKGAMLHIGASNTRRCWNMFPLPAGVTCDSNVGCCGIDGSNSSLIGASLASPDRIAFLYTGDLAFFYDLNSLGNRHVGKNVRILLVNNGIGAEFKLSVHRVYKYGERGDDYMAAGGHFGNKSPELIKHYAQDLGFEYLSASTKEEYLANLDLFTTPEMTDKPMLFEIFTRHQDESDALQLMTHFMVDGKHKLVGAVKGVLGEQGVSVLKKIVRGGGKCSSENVKFMNFSSSGNAARVRYRYAA